MLGGRSHRAISALPASSPIRFSPLSLIIPTHPRHSPVSPIIPAHTQKQGGGGAPLPAAPCVTPAQMQKCASPSDYYYGTYPKYVGAPTFSARKPEWATQKENRRSEDRPLHKQTPQPLQRRPPTCARAIHCQGFQPGERPNCELSTVDFALSFSLSQALQPAWMFLLHQSPITSRGPRFTPHAEERCGNARKSCVIRC